MRRVAPLGLVIAWAHVACSGNIDDVATSSAGDAFAETVSDVASPDAPHGDGRNDATPASDADAALVDSRASDSPTDSPPPPPPPPTCLGTAAGAYCGNDEMKDADASTLYECPGAGKAPTSSTKCADGCVVEPSGTPDHCKLVVSPTDYRLPWPTGTAMSLTQDCNDSCCSDHVGLDQWAWDWADGTSFTIVAARGGTITHVKINSTTGCGSSACANDMNFIVVDHGDGTQALYMHLLGMSLQPGISCGATVTSGQPLALAGTTGWSTGLHLHFQVEKVHAGAATCECGADGLGCAASSVPWSTIWVTSAYPTVSVTFSDWPSSAACANRRITMPPP